MNLESLSDKLDRALAWRKKEIGILRVCANRDAPSAATERRAALVLLCAHWEGFLRESIRIYFDFVFSQRLPAVELADSILAASMFRAVKNASAASFPGSESHCIRLAQHIRAQWLEGCPSLGWDVSTNSNPSSEVLCSLLRSAGIDDEIADGPGGWVSTRHFIDELLLKARNAIAHGEGLPVTAEHLLDCCDRVVSLCSALRQKIESAAASDQYRTSSRTEAEANAAASVDSDQ